MNEKLTCLHFTYPKSWGHFYVCHYMGEGQRMKDPQIEETLTPVLRTLTKPTSTQDSVLM